MAQIAYFGFKIDILGVAIELFLPSQGDACVSSLSELAVAKCLPCTTDSSTLLPRAACSYCCSTDFATEPVCAI
jgi:hypothetical protein